MPAIPYGGMQKFAGDLVVAQRALSIDARIALIYENDEFANRMRSLKVTVTVITGSRPTLTGAIDLSKLLREGTTEVVHLHGILFWVRCLGLMTKRMPWLLHVHSYSRVGNGLKAKLNWKLLRRLCDAVVYVSESVKSESASFPRKTAMDTIANGISIPALEKARRKPSTDAPVFGVAMRLTIDKGASEIPKLAAELNARCPAAQLVIAGEGPARTDLENEIHRLKLSHAVTFLGHCAEMANFWSQIDVSFFVSPRDTFGLTIVESVANGVPVFGYRTGAGSDELLANLAPQPYHPKTTAGELVETALVLIRNPTAYAEAQRSSHARAVQDYDLQTCAGRLNAIYRRIIKS